VDWMNSDWFWWAVALALFGLEALLPGTFMLWLGFAAAATGIVLLALPMSVTSQWIVFALLSLVAVGIGWSWRRRNPPKATDQPLLNRRADQLVGRVFALDTPVIDGRGRIKVDDAFWQVAGQDLPQGTRVRVAQVDGMLLRVERAE
jgi:membrane protein implicated in regulation of membrane protease activity